MTDRFDTFIAWDSTRMLHDREVAVARPDVPAALRAHRLELRARFPANVAAEQSWRWNVDPHGYSLVPIVPPDVRVGHKLAERFVLWEVEEWADSPIRATPDRDPYLLERIADDLFAVVGEWDLTPLEQAIMRDRAR